MIRGQEAKFTVLGVTFTRRVRRPWLAIGTMMLAGFVSAAVVALLIAWAVNDMMDNGVTWLPVFALVLVWQLVLGPGPTGSDE